MSDIDAGYGRFAHRLRALRPGLAEREIGLAWMRAETAAAGQSEIRLEGPEDFNIPPDIAARHGPTVTLHLLYEDGSTLNTAVVARDIPRLVDLIEGLSLDRIDGRDFIDEMFCLQRHTEQRVAECMAAVALWHALTSDVAKPLLRVIDSGHCRLVYQITHFVERGKKCVNFRMMAGDTRRPLAEMLAVGAIVPRTSDKLARRVRGYRS